ncbi:MAG TPA: Gfo/Idh/MocA family oxidoreductase [Luteolibacter sp.]|nr:Gfo/Idh/MocA family oxidoreductase [Luteolibacter sp.]
MSAFHPFQINRRRFLTQMSAAAAASGLPLWYAERLAAQQADATKEVKSPNERPRMMLVGCGGMGTGDARNSLRFADLVAVCDVDSKHAESTASRLTEGNKGRKPEIYKDFRKALERKDVDVVINGTPDHWHTLVNIGAAKAKKDIYSEKPLTLTIDEGKRVVKAVRENGVVLQTGTQQRSSTRFRLACELVRNKVIGDLKEVNVWLPAGLRGGPFQSQPVPAELDWDFWQGQAKAYDYCPERCHTTFRNWVDYSGGTMTDWGAHHMDIGYWAIGLVAPSKVQAKPLAQPIPGGYTTFSEYEVRFEYSNGVIYNVRTTTDDNPFGQTINPAGQRNGIRFEGSKGWIWVNRGEIKASDPELLRAELPASAERLYVSNDHRENFFECVANRKDPICAVEIGHRSATVCHLGTIALRTGKALQWDGEKEFFVGEHADEANSYVEREMRKPYDYSFVG